MLISLLGNFEKRVVIPDMSNTCAKLLIIGILLKLWFYRRGYCMTGRRKIGLVVSLAGFAISVNTLPTLVTWFSAKFSVASHWFGIIFLLQSAAFTFSAMSIGNLHKNRRLPLIKIAIISLFVSAIVLLFLGYSRSFLVLTLMMIVIGGSGGLVESIGTTLLSDGPQNRRMLYSSQFFWGVGAFSAPLIVGLLLKGGLDVPQIGMIIGSFALAVGFLVLILVLPNNADKQVQPIQEEQREAVTQGPKSQNGFMWLFLTIMTYVVLESSLSSWLPVFLETTYKVDSATASLTLTSYWIGLSLSRLFFIFFIKKTTRIPLMGHVFSLFLTILLFGLVGPKVPSLVTMLIVGLAGISSGPIWVLIIENCTETYKDSHLIMYLVGGGSIGAIIGPVLTSFLFSITDVSYMVYILIAYGIILSFLTIRATSLNRN